MAEELSPIVFRKSPEFAVNYSFTDVTSRTGYFIYYGTGALTATGTMSQIFVPVQIDSGAKIATGGAQKYYSSTSWNGELNFDTPIFKVQQILNGTVYLQIPCYAYQPNAMGGASSIAINDINLILVRGGAEIGTLATEIDAGTISSVSSEGEINYNSLVLAFAVTKTAIKVGDIIRLTLNCTIDDNAGIFHNPSNSSISITGNTTETSPSSQMVLMLPFELSL